MILRLTKSLNDIFSVQMSIRREKATFKFSSVQFIYFTNSINTTLIHLQSKCTKQAQRKTNKLETIYKNQI